MLDRAAQLVPSTFNEAENTVEVVWTTGAKVRRYDWWNETWYEEELVVSPEAVDMSRFDAGAVQALDSHSTWGVRNVLGICTRGWLDSGAGRASLKLSKREDIAGVIGDIRAGIIRNISVGYSVQRYEITRAQDRTDGVNMPLYRAVRWTPAELSFVSVPADAQSGTRSQPSQGEPCEFIRAAARTPQEPTRMDPKDPKGGAPATPEQNDPAAQARAAQEATAAAAAATAAAQAATAAATAAAVQRSGDITALCVRHGVPQLAEGLIRSSKSMEQVNKDVLDELARRDAAGGGHVNAGRIDTVSDEVKTRMEGWAEAIHHRVDPKVKLTDNGRQYRGMSMLEIGRDWLEARGINTRGMDRMSLAAKLLNFRSLGDNFQLRSGGMLTTSDFGHVLADVANKRLRMGYEENPGTYTRWARRAPNAPDFKNIKVVQLSALPDLLQVNEHGEFKYGKMTDGAESYALLTYGRIVSMSRQSLVNDDLRAFDRVVTGFGASAQRLENRTVYAQLTANANLGNDNVALFHATHANLGTGAGSALQFSALDSGRTAMRLQKGLQSEELNIVPSTLIVPAKLEQTAYQLTSSQYVPAVQSAVNEFRQGGKTALDPVVEPILDAVSQTAWYLAASNSQVDTVEYCWLDGAEGPVLESEMGFEVDGISFKCREDFAAKVIDFRGLYKANGA